MRQFPVWAQRASPERRAEAASALARAYLHSELTPLERAEAIVAMTGLLDDPSALVRRALAEAVAGAREVPRYVVVALANDHSEVAAAVLARSPILTDAELVDCAAIGDVFAQCAIARRADLGVAPSAALAEIGKREAAIALISNQGANLSAPTLRRLFERFGGDAEARGALLQRPLLEASLKADIAMATARDLSGAAARWLGSGRSECMVREATEQAIASIAASCRSEERWELARALRKQGVLTPALLLRSLLGGERDLFVAAIAELTRVPHPRVAAFVRDSNGEGFAALARRAGLPIHSLIAFRAALRALESYDGARGEGLKLPLVEKVIAACEERNDLALAAILSLLWRFASEAAKAEARRFTRHAAAGLPAPRQPQSLLFLPAAIDEGGESLPIDVVPDSTSASPEPTQFVASLEKPDGAAELCFELLIDGTASFEQAADEVGVERGSTRVQEFPPAVPVGLNSHTALDETDLEIAVGAQPTVDLLAASLAEGGSERDAASLPHPAYVPPTLCVRAPELSVAPIGSTGLAPLVESRFGRIPKLERAA